MTISKILNNNHPLKIFLKIIEISKIKNNLSNKFRKRDKSINKRFYNQ